MFGLTRRRAETIRVKNFLQFFLPIQLLSHYMKIKALDMLQYVKGRNSVGITPIHVYPAMVVKSINTFVTDSTVLAVLENLQENHHVEFSICQILIKEYRFTSLTLQVKFITSEIQNRHVFCCKFLSAVFYYRAVRKSLNYLCKCLSKFLRNHIKVEV